MNAHTAKEEMALLTPGFSRAEAFTGAENGAPASRPGLFARAVTWLREQGQRRAVVEELSMLTDRELADIGLARSDVPFVFDRAFATMRDEQRTGTGTGRAFGAYKLG